MDFLLSSQTAVAAAIFTLLIFLFSLSLRNGSNKRAAPEAAGAWPLIGHLHLLGGPEHLHRVLANMADKYGPIFTIKVGVHRSLIVSNWEIAKECLTTHDRVFANRPKTLAMEVLGYNFSMLAFSPYGSYWRHSRKIGTLELLSNHRLGKLKQARESEVKASLKELYELWDKNKNTSSSNQVQVEMRRWFGDTICNLFLRVIVGKGRYSMDIEHWEELMGRFFEMGGKLVVSDALPFLRWLDIGGDERSMKKIAKELDIVAQGWLDEHKKKRDSGELNGEEDLMDVMLSILDDAEQFPGRDLDTINKAMCLVRLS